MRETGGENAPRVGSLAHDDDDDDDDNDDDDKLLVTNLHLHLQPTQQTGSLLTD